MIRLYSHSSCPPGEFFIRIVFSQTDWSASQAGCGSPNCVQFGPSPLIEEVAKDMGAFLRSNNLPRNSFAECVQLIDTYTCERLGNGKQWCFDTEKNYNETTATILNREGKCGGCGVKV